MKKGEITDLAHLLVCFIFESDYCVVFAWSLIALNE